MVGRRYEIDMSKGSILKNMIMFAISLMLSNILQLLYNAADTIVVGRWGGAECLAAVGSTATVTGLLVNFFVGLSVGVAVAISRKYGAGDMYGLNKTAHTAVAISVIAGVASLVLGEVFCYPILELMGTPDDVINLASLYLRIIFLGTPAQLVYNFGAAILRSVGQAVKTPPFHGGNTSSILVRVTTFGSIAQLGEHLPYKQRVIGSIPIVPTKKTSFI